MGRKLPIWTLPDRKLGPTKPPPSSSPKPRRKSKRGKPNNEPFEELKGPERTFKGFKTKNGEEIPQVDGGETPIKEVRMISPLEERIDAPNPSIMNNAQRSALGGHEVTGPSVPSNGNEFKCDPCGVSYLQRWRWETHRRFDHRWCFCGQECSDDDWLKRHKLHAHGLS